MTQMGSCFFLLLLVGFLPSVVPQQRADLEFSSFAWYPLGVWIDAQTRGLLIATDRILFYESVDSMAQLINTTGPPPIFALGAPDTVTKGSVCSQQDVNNQARGIVMDDHGTLFVSDTLNSRVLYWYNASSLTNGSLASGVIGQSDFNSLTSHLGGQNTLGKPQGLGINGNQLWVADTNNNRIMQFNISSLVEFSSNAVSQIGQTNWAGNSEGLFTSPAGVISSSEGLYVANSGQGVVNYFTTAESLTSQYLGSSIHGTVNVTHLSGPAGVFLSSSGYLFIADTGNNRVLAYPPGSPNNYSTPVAIWGQFDLQSNNTGGNLTELQGPTGVFYDEQTNTLWIADSYNFRVLRYLNALPQSKLVVNNITLDVLLTFLGRSPHGYIFPNVGSGQPNTTVSVAPVVIQEVASDGSVLSAFSVPLVGYTINQTIDSSNNQIFPFYISVPNAANKTQELEIKYTLFGSSTTINSAGSTFVVNTNDVKLEYLLTGSGWTSGIPGGTIRMISQIQIQPKVISSQQIDFGNWTTFVFDSGFNRTFLRILHYAVVDGVNTPISFTLTETDNTANFTIYTLTLNFPLFTTSLLYDPDFSVTLQGSSSLSSSSGDGGSGGSLLPLLALIALVIPIAFVLICVAILVFLFVKSVRMQNGVGSQIAFDEDTL